MKKNLFLLSSIYFFVLQPVIAGILRGQNNFFRLAAINLVAIILIGLLYNTAEGVKEEKIEHEKIPVKEAKVSFHDHFRAAVKERKKKSELIFPFLVGAAASFIAFFLFPYNKASLIFMILIALIIGFIIFILLTLAFKHRITKSFRALRGTKIYLILLLVSIIFTAYDYYQVYKDFNASVSDYLAQNFLGQETIPTSGYVYTGVGTVLGSGLGDTTGGTESSSDVFSGLTTDTGVLAGSGSVLGSSTDTTTEQPLANDDTGSVALTIGNQKLMDAVIYLIDKYNVPLIPTKDISFTYVSFKNPYYNEWRTAYANKLIGKSTNPSKYIICDSYIVMKGLLEKWNVPYTSSTVLVNFRAEAIKRNALNGCVKGKIVTDKTL